MVDGQGAVDAGDGLTGGAVRQAACEAPPPGDLAPEHGSKGGGYEESGEGLGGEEARPTTQEVKGHDGSGQDHHADLGGEEVQVGWRHGLSQLYEPL